MTASQRLAYAAYDVAGAAMLALAVPALPWLWHRGLLAGVGQRLGRIPPLPRGAAPLWLHAASVGETLAALPLLQALRSRGLGGAPLLVSNTTLTGRALARREIAPQVSTLLPIDPLRIVDRALRQVRPGVLLIVETEIWPGLLRAADRAGAGIAVVSGRMSDRTHRRYAAAAPLFRGALGLVDVFCMQTDEDAARVRDLGAPASRVHVTGNLKAAAAERSGPPPVEGIAERPVVVAASTQPGEEAFVLDAAAELWGEHGDLLLVLAPRRPERFDEVASLVEERKISFVRRSHGTARIDSDVRVLLLDTLGELAGFYPRACAAFVGGTVAPIGGHNVLEPATAGAAVSFGPNLDNVRPAARALVDAGGGFEVAAATDLAAHWRAMLGSQEVARLAGARAREVAAQRAGVVAATMAQVEPLLQSAFGAPGIPQ